MTEISSTTTPSSRQPGRGAVIARGRSLRAFVRSQRAPRPRSRRELLRTAGLLALGVGGLAAVGACSEPGGGGEPSGGGSAAGSGGPVTFAKADVPEGGGAIQGAFVVTQPTAGEFKAFSSTCTHQGCPVSSVEEEAIICNCHGSEFSISDGSVLNGPAEDPLAAATVQADGDQLTVS